MNILKICTQEKNYCWLNYILQEFKRINKALFEIEICFNTDINDENNVIYYLPWKIEKPVIIDKSSVKPNGVIKYINDKIFIIDKTETTEKGFLFNYDIFWNIFVFLSRYEEFLCENKILSYSIKHPRKNKNSFRKPIVNYLFNELEQAITSLYHNLKFDNKKEFTIELTHDLDYIEKTKQLVLKQTFFNLKNTIQAIKTFDKFYDNFLYVFNFIFSKPNYWNFKEIIDLERNKNNKIFYIYTNTFRKKSIKEWLIDPSYNITTEIKLQKEIFNLLNNGYEIGLHGSYKSAINFELLEEEKTCLEKTLGISINRIRQHWLIYDEMVTPYIHDKLFTIDSTLGWNDIFGFRSGIASIHRLYNHKEQKPFNHFEVPQFLMDSNILAYGKSNQKELITNLFLILNIIKDLKNVYFAISWHPHVFSSDYNWAYLFRRIINQI